MGKVWGIACFLVTCLGADSCISSIYRSTPQISNLRPERHEPQQLAAVELDLPRNWGKVGEPPVQEGVGLPDQVHQRRDRLEHDAEVRHRVAREIGQWSF